MGPVSADLDALMRQRRNVTSESTMNLTIRDTRELAGGTCDRLCGVGLGSALLCGTQYSPAPL